MYIYTTAALLQNWFREGTSLAALGAHAEESGRLPEGPVGSQRPPEVSKVKQEEINSAVEKFDPR